mmetsp:Transcript_27887/g.64372  ORF Transcript_27887/g.64372 Transcript_27887/m.64372 type:complete len:98 (+) Transcript_27887:434-727(+)
MACDSTPSRRHSEVAKGHRYSIACFFDPDSLISVDPKYKPITIVQTTSCQGEANGVTEATPKTIEASWRVAVSLFCAFVGDISERHGRILRQRTQQS